MLQHNQFNARPHLFKLAVIHQLAYVIFIIIYNGSVTLKVEMSYMRNKFWTHTHLCMCVMFYVHYIIYIFTIFLFPNLLTRPSFSFRHEYLIYGPRKCDVSLMSSLNDHQVFFQHQSQAIKESCQVTSREVPKIDCGITTSSIYFLLYVQKHFLTKSKKNHPKGAVNMLFNLFNITKSQFRSNCLSTKTTYNGVF